MGELQELNLKMYDFVKHWPDGTELTVSGVSLPDCMAYDALSVIGRQLLSEIEPPGTEETEKTGQAQVLPLQKVAA